ncbi:MAG: heme A synthase [Balneola sp.]|nr:MAG: heme A synthase [Balneola sp.]
MKLNPYQKTAFATVFATLFLILVGGLVRAAGAGLGCPDWPKCFGTWIPPTNVVDLPPEFEASQFNVWKTWIEYVNRLVGVVIGLLIIATFVRSFRYRKSVPSVFYSSGAAFVLVLVQGWLGGQVVKTGLSEWMITIHMILALIIVNVLVYASFKSATEFIKIELSEAVRKKLFITGSVLLGITFIQLVLGTQVREAIDVIKEADGIIPPRSTWIGKVGDIFSIHRSFSWLVLISGAVLMYFVYRPKLSGPIFKLANLNFVFILSQIAAGVILEYFDMPPAFQVVHLVGIALMVCAQFLMLLMLRLRVTD